MGFSEFERRRTVITAELGDVRKRLKFAKQEESSLVDRLKIVQSQIAASKTKSSCLEVSDHAVVRYLERILDINIKEKIKETINKNVSAFGDGEYSLSTAEQAIAIVVNNIVVTIK